MFLAALDQTIVATSIRTIADDLQGLSVQAWVTTAYLITATISTPLYGKLSDLYGRRPFFLTAITIFVLGSALCGFATSMYQLAAFRAFQGLGAGGLFSLALTIIGDIVPPRERAKYQGYFLAVFGTSSVLGPVVGGFLAGQDTILGITGWRWVFLVNVPIGIVRAAARRAQPAPAAHPPRPPDRLAGRARADRRARAAADRRRAGPRAGAGPRARRSRRYRHRRRSASRPSCWPRRRYGDDALLPLRLFRGRTFGIGLVLNFIIGMGMFGGLAALPLYLQIVKGVSPTEAGLLLLPLTAGIMAGSIISGQIISRTGRYKIFPVIGSVLLVLGMLAGSASRRRHRRSGVTMLIWRRLRARARLQHAAAGARGAERRAAAGHGRGDLVGHVLPADGRHAGHRGVPVDPVLHGGRQDHGGLPRRRDDTAALPGRAERPAGAGRPDQRARSSTAITSGGGLPKGALDDTSFLSHLDDRLARPFLEGFSGSIDLVFLSAAAVLLVAFVVVFFLPEEQLRTCRASRPGAQDADDAAAAAADAGPGS